MRQLLIILLAWALSASQVLAVGTSQPASGAGGGSATPGGSNGAIQYNNNGALGGLATVPVANGGTGVSSASLIADSVGRNTAILLPKLRACMAKVAAGTGSCFVLNAGDSTTSGNYSNGSTTNSGDQITLSYPSQLVNMLNAVGINSNWNGFYGFSGSTQDSRLTVGSDWSVTGLSTLGGAFAQATASSGNPLVFSPKNPVNTFVVTYITTSGGGTLSASVNGGTAVTQSQNAATGFATMTVTAPLGADSLALSWLSGGTVYVAGIKAYDSTKSWVNIENAGWPGSKATDWAGSNTPYGASTMLGSLGQDATILQLGINDWVAQESQGTFSAAMQTLITNAKSQGDVILVAPVPSYPGANYSQIQQQAYIATLQSLAVSNNIVFVDMFDRFVSFAVAQPLGLMTPSTVGSGLHPLGAGYGDIARAIFNVINSGSGTGPTTVLNGGTGQSKASPAGFVLGTNPVPGATGEYPFTDGTGTTVADVSGNGNTGTFGTYLPTWAPYGLLFNAGGGANSNQYVQTPIKTWKTLAINVCSGTYSQNNQGVFWPDIPLQSVANANLFTDGLLLITQPSTGQIGATSFAPGIYAVPTSSFNTRSNSFTTKPCSTIVYTLDTLDHVYIDGQEISYLAQGASASKVTTTGTGYALGGTGVSGNSNPNESLNGSITYAVFYPNVLTPAQVGQLSTFINNTVAARPQFPNNIPGSNTTGSTLDLNGDSLSGGVTSLPWANSTYITPTKAYNIVSWAINGDGAINSIANGLMRWMSSMSNAGGRNIVHHWLGTNDVAIFGYTAAQTWNNLQILATETKAKGGIPVIATMISRTGQDTNKNALNALIRAGWQTAGFAALNDLAAVPVLGADGANTNTACFNSDKVHLTTPGAGTCLNSVGGYGVVAQQVTKVVNILDGSTASNPTVTASNAYTQLIGDNFVLQTPTAAATDTLPDCTGLTGIVRTIYNGSSSFAITAGTSNSQTITGSNAVLANGVGAFTCELISPSTGGNYWLRSQ